MPGPRYTRTKAKKQAIANVQTVTRAIGQAVKGAEKAKRQAAAAPKTAAPKPTSIAPAFSRTLVKPTPAKKTKKPKRQKVKVGSTTEVAVDAANWNAAMKRTGIGAKTSYNLYANPGAVEQANYEGYMRRRLWPAMRRELGLPKSTPMPKFDYGDLQDHAAHVGMGPEPGKRKVTFGIETAMRADLRPARDRKRTKSSSYARRVPLHEWAHVFQSTKPNEERLRELLEADEETWREFLAKSRQRDEGGAEAFAQDLARKLGIGIGHRSYPKATRNVRRRRGGQYIREGQFQ